MKRLSRSTQEKLQKAAAKDTQEPNITSNWTSKEEGSLVDYTGRGYLTINAELRSGKVSKKTEKVVKDMDNILSKNILQEDVIVYRGTNASFDSDKAYISTSTSVNNARNFARGENARIEAYRIPKGTKAIWIGNGEKELILPRGFDLKKHRLKI